MCVLSVFLCINAHLSSHPDFLNKVLVHLKMDEWIVSTKEIVLVITADSVVCGLSSVTKTLFVQRHIAVEFLL